MLAALYFEVMNIRPEEPKWADRDRFVLSKGHASPAYYSALARRGYFSTDRLKVSALSAIIWRARPAQSLRV